jgi:pyruvate-formate lyase-activating enzyme
MIRAALPPRLRCRQAFEEACVHANGDVVCSIIDGRGEFVLGSVYEQPLDEIFAGERARRLRRLVLGAPASYCPGIGNHCPLKRTPVEAGREPRPLIRVLAIEPTTACDLRCLACLVRDFDRRVGWRDAYGDGGLRFLAWDALRRSKQRCAGLLSRILPRAAVRSPHGRWGALLLRGRMPASRAGALPVETIGRIVTEAGPAVERIDLFGYGEPFLYAELLEALRCIRARRPLTTIAVSTNGLNVSPTAEEAIVTERLVDWWVFSIDGSDAGSYRRYRVGGDFERALSNLVRAHRRATPAGIRVIWQYVVFRWNDGDDQLKAAIATAATLGIPIWFDFASTFGRSRRGRDGLQYLVPYLRPGSTLPGRTDRSGPTASP